MRRQSRCSHHNKLTNRKISQMYLKIANRVRMTKNKSQMRRKRRRKMKMRKTLQVSLMK